jgi:UDP-N-acetylmuramoylalanine--D-glutamate ligase
MRQPISWSALADARVGVWGLGVEGRASIRRLASMGVTPVLVDDAPAAPTIDGQPVLATEPDGLRALLACDVVVKSPGISRYRPDVGHLEAGGVTVCGGLGLFMAGADPSRVACITGTKGKSTTTAIAVHLLASLGFDARAGGNIGHPPWDTDEADDPDYWIVETSSFQVPDLAVGPHVVAVTSLSPDHLDWHGTVERYYADKLALATLPGVTLALADGSDERLRGQAPLLGPHVRWVGPEEVARDAAWSSALGLAGPHNARNASIARAVVAGLGIPGTTDDAALARAAAGFDALPSRFRSLGRFGGIEFVDDGLSTNVLPAQAALAAFTDRPVALLVGGHDRGLDYEPLARTVAGRTGPTLVVTMPDNGPRIGEAMRAVGGGRVDVVDRDGLDDAVDAAYAWASTVGPSSVVLLSPAAPSFGRFGDYRERSAAFAAAAARQGPLRR